MAECTRNLLRPQILFSFEDLGFTYAEFAVKKGAGDIAQ
jgi:hypothetical protein